MSDYKQSELRETLRLSLIISDTPKNREILKDACLALEQQVSKCEAFTVLKLSLETVLRCDNPNKRSVPQFPTPQPAQGEGA